MSKGMKMQDFIAKAERALMGADTLVKAGDIVSYEDFSLAVEKANMFVKSIKEMLLSRSIGKKRC